MPGGRKYPPRTPRFASGVKSQTVRLSSIRPWWAKRWLAAIEPMSIAGRMSRGRNYAVSGQTVGISILPGRVEASVVGTREKPYSVTLDFAMPDPAAREAAIREIKAEPMRVARLLADDFPIEIEGILSKAGGRLFPGGKAPDGSYDMKVSCTCPDWARPCKHAYAVLLLVCEEIARRPLTLLELRGIMEEDLVDED